MGQRKKCVWRWSRLSLLLLLLAVLPGEGRAALYTYGFARITSNSTVDVASQLLADVTSDGYGSNQVLFTLRNAGPVPSSITDIYFDDGTILESMVTLIDKDDHYGSGSFGLGGVDFSQDAAPSNLPSANSAVPVFEVTKDFSADSDPRVQPNGVNPGEWLGILFDLKSGKTLANVLADLASGELRIGIHVQGLPDNGEESDSFVNTPPVHAPVPGAVLLGMLGLSAAGVKLRRFA